MQSIVSGAICRKESYREANLGRTVGCSNLGSTYGAQVFRAVRLKFPTNYATVAYRFLLVFQKDAPQYRTAFAACIALSAVWLTSVGLHTIQYAWSNRRLEKKWAVEAGTLDQSEKSVDQKLASRPAKFFW